MGTLWDFEMTPGLRSPLTICVDMNSYPMNIHQESLILQWYELISHDHIFSINHIFITNHNSDIHHKSVSYECSSDMPLIFIISIISWSGRKPASEDARLRDVSARPWLEPTGAAWKLDEIGGTCFVKIGKSPINGNVTGRILELNGGFSSTPLYRRVKCLKDLFCHAHPYSMHIDLYKGTSLPEKTLFTIKCDFVSCTDPSELEITTWLLWHDYYPLNG